MLIFLALTHTTAICALAADCLHRFQAIKARTAEDNRRALAIRVRAVADRQNWRG